MKNWKHPEEYRPLAENLSDHGWAWEFLRRNPEYREEWEQLQPESRSHRLNDSCHRKWGLLFYVDPSADLDEPEKMLCPVTMERIPLPQDEDDQASPSHRPKLVHLDYSSLRELFRGTDLEWPTSALSPGVAPYCVTVLFDLQRHVKPQLAGVGELLRQIQDYWKDGEIRVPRPTHHKKNWWFYLLLLDAQRDDASLEEIARCFEGEGDPLDPNKEMDVEKVSDRLKTAHALTKPEGYLGILPSIFFWVGLPVESSSANEEDGAA